MWKIYLVLTIFSTESVSDESVIKVTPIRQPNGGNLLLKCYHPNKIINNDIIWEFQLCPSRYTGVMCNNEKCNQYDRKSWKQLPTSNENTNRLKIDNVNETHNGMYRCVNRQQILKCFTVEIVYTLQHHQPPPQIDLLKTENTTNFHDIEITFFCHITSVFPPSVHWLKICHGSKCDVKYNNICYCPMNVSNFVHNIGGPQTNHYLSKINIINARKIDSGIYVCVATTFYGMASKNVSLEIQETEMNDGFTIAFVFFVLLATVLVLFLMFLCYFNKKRKTVGNVPRYHKQQLIQMRMQLPPGLNKNEVVTL